MMEIKMSTYNFIYILLIPLFIVGVFSGLYFRKLYVKYGLELFEDLNIKYKEYITTNNHKFMTVGYLKILSAVKNRNPVAFYSHYAICFVGFSLFLILAIKQY